MKKISLLVVILLLSLASCKKSGDTTHAVRKDITQAVYASGKVYPKNDYKVLSKLPGYVLKIYVHVGDSVNVGQPLLTIKSEISDLNVSSAKNLFELAQDNAKENSDFMTALKQDVASAKTKYELDSTNYSRYSNLLKDNATSRLQADQAETQYNISKQNYIKAGSQLKNTREKLRIELDNARIQYEAQQSNKSDYTLVSAVAGKIYDIIPKEGELINIQAILMEIGDSKNYEVELSVDETDVSLLKKGQEIVYAIDAYKDVVYKGQLNEIYPRISQINKTSKILSGITVDDKTMVFSGMSVEANIIITEKKNALVVPREYIFDSNKVKIKGSDTPVKITKGAEDLEFIEVLSGIDETTELVKP